MTAKENYLMLMEKLAKSLHLDELKPDDTNMLALEISASLPLYLQFSEQRESILFVCEIANIPVHTPSKIYRTLLEAQLFDQGTGGGKFALDTESNTLIFTFEFMLNSPTFDIFQEVLENYIVFCKHWHALILSQCAELSKNTNGDELFLASSVLKA